MIMNNNQKKVVVNEAFLETVRLLVLKGAEYNKQIYTFLDVSERTWCRLKSKHPEIQETIDRAKAELDQMILPNYYKILMDPEHKRHADMLKHYVDHMHRRLGKQKIELVKEESSPELENLSPDELLQLLDDTNKQTKQSTIN
jgi:hypothetical protein